VGYTTVEQLGGSTNTPLHTQSAAHKKEARIADQLLVEQLYILKAVR
jgi:hypothetical protein